MVDCGKRVMVLSDERVQCRPDISHIAISRHWYRDLLQFSADWLVVELIIGRDDGDENRDRSWNGAWKNWDFEDHAGAWRHLDLMES